MSNIVYVPEWCKRHIDSQDESLDSLDVDDVRKSIVSVVDVNNYLMAQCELQVKHPLNSMAPPSSHHHSQGWI